MPDSNQIIKEIDDLYHIFMSCKSIFPKLDYSMKGETSTPTAPFYQNQGYNLSLHFGHPLTTEFIEVHHNIGNWINENAIVRLYGILNYHKLYIKIDQSFEGWKHIDLCRRIRNIITKTKLNYNPNDTDNLKLREEIIEFYNLKQNEYEEGEIPTPVDSVITPMFEGCKTYISNKF